MKKQEIESVVHSWVNSLPFMQQAVLLVALRGPDGIEKYSPAKHICYYLRGIVLKPAFGTPEGNGEFMWFDYSDFAHVANTFFNDTDKYPMHFLMHICHAAEILAHQLPDADTEYENLSSSMSEIKAHWKKFYNHFCKCLHMNPETAEQLNNRLDH